MLKIVELMPGETANKEYVVLQNQGIVTVSLRGWALCGDTWLSGDIDSALSEIYIFREDIAIKPYTRVVLFTSMGEDGWRPTTDGKQAYLAFWNKEWPVWSRCGYVHLLQVAGSRKVVDQPVIAHVS
jgi:hypothetical protein